MRIDTRSWLPLIAAAGLCALALSWRAGAGAASSGAPQTSVAVVSLQRLLDGLTELKDHRGRLMDEANRLSAEFDQKREDLRALVEERDELPPGSAAWREKFMEGLSLRATINAQGEAQERWLEMEQARVLKEMFAKAERAVQAIATRDGWDVILWDHAANPALTLDSQQPMERFEVMTLRILGRGVAFTSPRADVTQHVIDTMNNAYAAGQ
jgi:Skp family chaperone for outer membrane proteins